MDTRTRHKGAKRIKDLRDKGTQGRMGKGKKG